jgi:hypothetical protein
VNRLVEPLVWILLSKLLPLGKLGCSCLIHFRDKAGRRYLVSLGRNVESAVWVLLHYSTANRFFPVWGPPWSAPLLVEIFVRVKFILLWLLGGLWLLGLGSLLKIGVELLGVRGNLPCVIDVWSLALQFRQCFPCHLGWVKISVNPHADLLS